MNMTSAFPCKKGGNPIITQRLPDDDPTSGPTLLGLCARLRRRRADFSRFSFWLLHLLSLIITLRQQEILHNSGVSVHIALKQMPVTQRDEFCVPQHGLKCWANILGQRSLELLMCRRSETKATFCTFLLAFA